MSYFDHDYQDHHHDQQDDHDDHCADHQLLKSETLPTGSPSQLCSSALHWCWAAGARVGGDGPEPVEIVIIICKVIVFIVVHMVANCTCEPTE